MSSSESIFRIGIIGAGIGGLTLAALLLADAAEIKNRSGVTLCIQVFERDESFDSRAQGYALTIQRNGMEVFDTIGIGARLRKLECRCASNWSCRADGTTLAAFDPRVGSKSQKSNIPLPRQHLRKMLIEEIERLNGDGGEQVLFWGKSLQNFSQNNDHVEATFVDGSTQTFDLLVACDGLRSIVRERLVPSSKIHFVGYWIVNAIVDWSTSGTEDQRKELKNRVFQVMDGQSRLFVKPFLPGKSMWQLTFPIGEDAVEKFQAMSNEQILEHVRSLTSTWTHDLAKVLLSNTPIASLRSAALCDIDPMRPWETSRVTMLGDACHPMTPFRGMGANNAIVDCADIRRVIHAHLIEKKPLLDELRVHEKQMLERTRRVVMSSRNATLFLHTADCLDNQKFYKYLGLKDDEAAKMDEIVAVLDKSKQD